MKKIVKVPEASILVTANTVVLYPSILHKEGILAFISKLEEKIYLNIATNDLVMLAEFVLVKLFFEFISETTDL